MNSKEMILKKIISRTQLHDCKTYCLLLESEFDMLKKELQKSNLTCKGLKSQLYKLQNGPTTTQEELQAEGSWKQEANKFEEFELTNVNLRLNLQHKDLSYQFRI